MHGHHASLCRPLRPLILLAAPVSCASFVLNNTLRAEGESTLATILYRYAGLRGVPTGGRADLGSFPDGGAVSGWAYDALSWANAAGLIAGTREGGVDYLAPQQNATRAQVAVILMRYLGAA